MIVASSGHLKVAAIVRGSQSILSGMCPSVPSGGPPPPGFFISVHFERVKVICFDTLLQVLILKTLHCTGTVRVRPAETPFRRMVFPGWESKNASREAGVTMLRRWYYDAQTRFYPWFTVHER